MSLIRAEIRDRRGSNSIYDGVVEYASDFESERMLQSMHPGSLVLCLNLPASESSDSTDPDASELYVKREDGSWSKVTTVTKGSEGAPGESAYQVAVDNGFEGTEQEWLDSLHGEDASMEGAVLYTAQTLTNEQKAQARENIGVNGSGGGNTLIVHFSVSGNTYSCDTSINDILDAINNDSIVIGNLWDQDILSVLSYSEFGVRFGKLVINDVPAGNTEQVDVYKLVGYTENNVDTWTMKVIALTVKPHLVSDLQSTAVTLTPYDNQIYRYGTLTSLTITNPPVTVTSSWSVIFTSGSTPTVVNGIDNFTVQANKRYRIDVYGGYATFDSWPYTP